MKSLPIGISTLRFLIEDNMVYIDKTGIIEPLVSQKGRYFLSRPRRFGKSLLVDTFKELFEGNEALFKNLTIHDRWDWSKKYPVIKIDWASGGVKNPDLLAMHTRDILDENARRLDIPLPDEKLSPGLQLGDLIAQANHAYNSQVVVLVDEYDKPLLDNIENPEMAMIIREELKSFYSPIKRMDSLLQFVFLTGVSKFSKVNIFSGINNLSDITLDENYATICGYTQNDLEIDFAEHLEGVDMAELKRWYNGYGFLGEPVYNPFDILLFISKNKSYRNYWFETGTPSFLVKMMQKNRYFLPDLEVVEAGEELLSSFEIETMEPVTLLFQSGYLTIKKHEFFMNRQIFTLGFPNIEVKNAFTDYLVSAYTKVVTEKIRFGSAAYNALRSADMAGLETALRRLFAGIPWRNFTNNDLADYEGYYASVLYAFFSSITCTVIAEDTTNKGQADLTVMLDDVICVTEVKVTDTGEADDGPNSALVQVQQRNYAEKYTGEPGKKVFEVGMVFSKKERNLSRFDVWERTA